jgi:hypothetical protein
MFHNETVAWSSERLHVKAVEIINNRVHSATGYTPFEVLRNRRNVAYQRKLLQEIGIEAVAEPPQQFVPQEIEKMHSLVQSRLQAQADQMVKRSSGAFEPYKHGDVVYVLAFRNARGRRTLHKLMEPAAEVIELHEPASYHVRWITQGPHTADKPGTISTRTYHHAYVSIL